MVADGNITSGFFGATASNSPSGIVPIIMAWKFERRQADEGFLFNVNAQLAFARNKIVNMNEAFKPLRLLEIDRQTFKDNFTGWKL